MKNKKKQKKQINLFQERVRSAITSQPFGSNLLHERVHQFEKAANDMIAKLTETLQAIERADNKPGTVDNLKLSIAPDAATLISQGDSLVLETHEYNSDLSAAVMKIQTALRQKYRAVQHNG